MANRRTRSRRSARRSSTWSSARRSSSRKINRQWSGAEINFMRKYYRRYETSWVARQLGRSVYSIRYKAVDLHLRKANPSIWKGNHGPANAFNKKAAWSRSTSKTTRRSASRRRTTRSRSYRATSYRRMARKTTGRRTRRH